MANNNDVLGIHAQALAFRARRAEILATNLANADTPGYQARDVILYIGETSNGDVPLRRF